MGDVVSVSVPTGGRYINTQNEKGGERWKRIKQAGDF
jgi:hypothetical protein